MLRICVLLISAVAISGCGPSSEPDAGTSPDLGSQTTEPVQQPVETEQVLEQKEERAAVATPRCPQDPSTFCRGPVTVRVENINLAKDPYRFGAGTPGYVARVSYTIENSSDAPIRFNILARETVNLTLENGIDLKLADLREITGVEPCASNMDRCLQRQSSDFVDLQLGDSPASIDLVFAGRINAALDRSAPRVTTAAVNLPIIVETGDASPTKIDATFRNVPIFNTLGG